MLHIRNKNTKKKLLDEKNKKEPIIFKSYRVHSIILVARVMATFHQPTR